MARSTQVRKQLDGSGLARLVRMATLVALASAGCDTPNTTVVLKNGYPSSTSDAFVIDRAFWQAVSFPTPIAPGDTSDPQNTVPATDNDAYVVITPGGAGDGGAATPTSFVVLQSRAGYTVHLDESLVITVDDTSFAGNCGVGSHLTQAQADFITQRVFASDFAGLGYDAATCTTTTGP